MKTLVSKMKSLKLLKVEFVVGAIIMLVSAVAVPLSVFIPDPTLFTNPYVLGTVFVAALIFCLLGYFLFIRPYYLYRKMPSVLLETDGEYLYVHGNKEAKIPFSEISKVIVYSELPFIYHRSFIREFIVHVFSEEYGIILLEIPNYGTYKLRFVAHAEDVKYELVEYFNGILNNESVAEN